jgi:hypothetical protein
MKKMFLIFLFVICVINVNNASPFQNNTVVVVRVGTGTGSLTNAATAVFLDEYNTTTGALVQTIPLPTTISGANKRFVLSGTNSSEGYLTLSTDVNYLVLGGYDAAVGTDSISNTTSAANNRVIARFAQTGAIDVITALTDAYSGGSINGVTSTDGSNFWTSGSNDGVKYATLGGTTSTQLSTTPANIRCINIFNRQLYITLQVTGFFAVGSGLPTAAGQTILELTGFPTSGTQISPYAFQMNPTGNIIYVACGNTNYGIQKWTLSGGTWSLAYTISPTISFTGIVVDWTGTNPVIYATNLTSNANAIYKGTDVSNGSSVTVLTTAAANTIFRGISFTPVTVLPVELSSFTSMANGRNIQLNWETKTEKNSDKFVIERKTIGASWEAMGSVKAAVLSNSPKQYSFADKNLQSGKYQYRLKMVDNDGSFSYSSIEAAEVAVPKDFAVSQNYPNPFNPSTKIDYQVPVDAKVIMEVYNIAGQKVSELVNQEQSAGYYSVDFGSSKLSSGVYIYRIVVSDKATGNNFSSIKKMMLLK